MARPPRRARVVQRDDEIGARRGLEAGADRRHGVSRSDSEIAQKSWPSGAPSPAAAACIALTPGATDDLDRRPVAPPLALDQLEDQRGEAVNAGIAGRDQRDRPAAAARSSASRARAASCADRAVVPALAGDRAAEQIEIEP